MPYADPIPQSVMAAALAGVPPENAREVESAVWRALRALKAARG